MGRGNVCVTGPYEGLFYIDNDDLLVYRPLESSGLDADQRLLLGELDVDELQDWEYSEGDSYWLMEEVKSAFAASMKNRFPSFQTPRKQEWINDGLVIVENSLFAVTFEDNQWSTAVKLLQKEHWCYDYAGLQKQHYQRYLDGIRDALFEQFETLGTYGGAWTSGRISRKEILYGQVHTA